VLLRTKPVTISYLSRNNWTTETEADQEKQRERSPAVTKEFTLRSSSSRIFRV
jgi:hypothetical protein